MSWDLAIGAAIGLASNIGVSGWFACCGDEWLRPGYERRLAHADRLLYSEVAALFARQHTVDLDHLFPIQASIARELRVIPEDMAGVREIRGALLRSLVRAPLTGQSSTRFIDATACLTDRREAIRPGAPQRRDADRRLNRQIARRRGHLLGLATGLLAGALTVAVSTSPLDARILAAPPALIGLYCLFVARKLRPLAARPLEQSESADIIVLPSDATGTAEEKPKPVSGPQLILDSDGNTALIPSSSSAGV